jgi:hypothetical protein
MRNLNSKSNQILKAITGVGLALILSSCTGYKTSWDCPKVKGIGCSSLEYADEIARKQILLNTDKKQKKEILIRKNENNFELDEIY